MRSHVADPNTVKPPDPGSSVPPKRPARKHSIRSVLRVGFRDYAIVISLLVLIFALTVLSDAFLTKTNLLNVLDQSVSLGIVASAGTFVIIAAGFDLSVGSVFVVAGVVAALVTNEAGPVAGLVCGPAVGLAFGAMNGVLVTTARITPFLATLGSGIVIGGIATLITGGAVVAVENPGFETLGKGNFLGIRNSIWLLAAWFIACGLLLSRTTIGRAVYAVGSNANVAHLSGVQVDRIRVFTFVISGLAAGIAGTISASRFALAQAGVGQGITLTAIAAIAIGGTSILGGQGAMWRTAVGVAMLVLLQNGLTLLAVNPAYRDVLTGAIIIFAVALDALSRRTAGR